MGTETTTRNHYSTLDVAELSGASYRQLDYWCRLGLIRASAAGAAGSGSRRVFSAHDAAICKVLAALNHSGSPGRVPLNRLEALVGFLTDLPLQQWAATSVMLDMSGDVWLLTDAAPKVGLHIDLSLVFDPVAA